MLQNDHFSRSMHWLEDEGLKAESLSYFSSKSEYFLTHEAFSCSKTRILFSRSDSFICRLCLALRAQSRLIARLRFRRSSSFWDNWLSLRFGRGPGLIDSSTGKSFFISDSRSFCFFVGWACVLTSVFSTKVNITFPSTACWNSYNWLFTIKPSISRPGFFSGSFTPFWSGVSKSFIINSDSKVESCWFFIFINRIKWQTVSQFRILNPLWNIQRCLFGNFQQNVHSSFQPFSAFKLNLQNELVLINSVSWQATIRSLINNINLHTAETLRNFRV